MADKLESKGWLVRADRGDFIVVAISSSDAMRFAGIIASEKFGEISLIEEVGEAVFVGELVEPEEFSGKDILQLFDLKVP